MIDLQSQLVEDRQKKPHRQLSTWFRESKLMTSPKIRGLFKIFLAEFIGTFFITILGVGARAEFKFTEKSSLSSMQVPIAFACGLFIGVLATVNVSGAHINPAVTFIQIILREISFKKALVYLSAQFLGAFVGAALIFLNYYTYFSDYSQNIAKQRYFDEVSSIFSTYPSIGTSNYVAFFDNFLATLLFIFIVKTSTDKRNCEQGSFNIAFNISLAAIMLGISFSQNCGSTVNPAVDFSPRLFSACLLGGEVFTHKSGYFWIPLVAPLFGGIFGILVYRIIQKADYLAEMVGTCLLALVVMMAAFSDAPKIQVVISLAIGIYFAVLSTYRISGGHLNPCVTITKAVHKIIPLKKACVYVGAQFLGAFIGAILTYTNNYDYVEYSLSQKEANIDRIRRSFASYPLRVILPDLEEYDKTNSNLVCFLSSMLGTTVIMFYSFALPKNSDANSIAKGIVYSVIGLYYAFGANCGAPFNPAADFSGRLFSLMIGCGTATFSSFSYFFWIPIVAPIAGGILGSYLYLFTIGYHLDFQAKYEQENLTQSKLQNIQEEEEDDDDDDLEVMRQIKQKQSSELSNSSEVE